MSRQGEHPLSKNKRDSKVRMLFVCTRNQLRSPTAEALFVNVQGVEAISAGTNNDCETPLSGDLIEWADEIYVMEKIHLSKISQRFGVMLKGKNVRVLGIADNFGFMAPDLVAILRRKFPQWFAAQNS